MSIDLRRLAIDETCSTADKEGHGIADIVKLTEVPDRMEFAKLFLGIGRDNRRN